MGVLKMSSPLKSRASQKFRANHPYQHQMFSILVKGAKQTKTKFMFQREEDEINNELSNMLQNQQNMLFRPADLTDNQLKKGSPNPKRVSWKESLFEEQTIPEEQFFVQEANLVQQTCNKQIWEEKLFPRVRPGKPDLLQQLGCAPSKMSVGNNVGNSQDHAQVAQYTESGDTRNLLTNPSNSPLPDKPVSKLPAWAELCQTCYSGQTWLISKDSNLVRMTCMNHHHTEHRHMEHHHL